MNSNFYITKDFDKMNIEFIHDYLSNRSYWAKGRSIEKVVESMQNSICYGVLDANNKQVGFARIVTDYVVFAWVMDVFVDENYQGKGIGEFLMKTIVDEPALQGINGIGLRTKDAHGLYEKLGFKKIEEPDTWMLRKES